MSNFLLSQVLASIAICFDLLSFQFKNRKHIVCCLFFSCMFISAHFALLEEWTASIIVGIAAVRYLTGVFSTSKKLAYFFIASALAATALTYSGIPSLISCSGTVLQTFAVFSKNDKQLRQIMVVGISLWLLHNYLVGSPMAVLMEMLFLSSNLVGYYRFYIRKSVPKVNET